MAPIAVVFLLPATLMMEENVVGITLALARDDVKIIWYLLFNSALAYLVNLTNFLVTKHTSALTLQVCLTYSYRQTSLSFANFNILLNKRICFHTQVYCQNVIVFFNFFISVCSLVPSFSCCYLSWRFIIIFSFL